MRRTKRTLKGAFFVAKEVVVMYTKLDTKEEIRAYTPQHVQEIILFLKKRKFNIEAFKSLTSLFLEYWGNDDEVTKD